MIRTIRNAMAALRLFLASADVHRQVANHYVRRGADVVAGRPVAVLS